MAFSAFTELVKCINSTNSVQWLSRNRSWNNQSSYRIHWSPGTSIRPMPRYFFSRLKSRPIVLKLVCRHFNGWSRWKSVALAVISDESNRIRSVYVQKRTYIPYSYLFKQKMRSEMTCSADRILWRGIWHHFSWRLRFCIHKYRKNPDSKEFSLFVNFYTKCIVGYAQRWWIQESERSKQRLCHLLVPLTDCNPQWQQSRNFCKVKLLRECCLFLQKM